MTGAVARACVTLLVIVAGAALLKAGPRAPSPDMTPWVENGLHIKILMRALTYEQSLDRKAGTSIRVGVLYDPSSTDSVQASMTAIALFQAQARTMTFKERRILVVGVPIQRDDARLMEDLAADLKVAYLTPGLAQQTVERVVAATRTLGVISMSALRDHVRWGVALGVALQAGKPRILVNLAAARLEGAEFSSQLLQLADLIRSKARAKTPPPTTPASRTTRELPGADATPPDGAGGVQ